TSSRKQAQRAVASTEVRARTPWIRPDLPADDDIRRLLPRSDGVWRSPRPELVADRIAVSLCLARDRIALPLARAARRLVNAKVWFEFGYARLEDHARERFGRWWRGVRDVAGLGAGADGPHCLWGARHAED